MSVDFLSKLLLITLVICLSTNAFTYTLLTFSEQASQARSSSSYLQSGQQ